MISTNMLINAFISFSEHGIPSARVVVDRPTLAAAATVDKSYSTAEAVAAGVDEAAATEEAEEAVVVGLVAADPRARGKETVDVEPLSNVILSSLPLPQPLPAMLLR
jgi:hypothetical protein